MAHPKHVNHELSPMRCPVDLDDVHLFGDGGQEHRYEAYQILHREAPVLRIEGGGLTPGTDAFVLTRHRNVTMVVRDNLMQASMLSLRPTQPLYLQHRRELTDPWVGPGALRHRAMIAEHANHLLGQWIDDGEVEFITRFARPLEEPLNLGTGR